MQWIASFNFNAGDTSETTKGGLSFLSIQAIGTPSGETESGLDFTYPATTPDLDPPNSEIRFEHTEVNETWNLMRFYVPANFFLRGCVGMTVAGDITNWQVGDTVTGVDGTSTGELWAIVGTKVYLNFADNWWDNAVWNGSITNTTRAETRTSSERSFEANNNKLFAKWVDGYSNTGAGPTIVWEFSGDDTGGAQLGQQYSAGQYTVTGAHGEPQLYAQNFIRYPEDLGTWMEVMFHVKLASARGVNDGVIEVYLKREGEEDFTLFLQDTTADIAPPVEDVPVTGLANGYFIGYSNSGYDVDTSFYVSQFWHGIEAATVIGNAVTAEVPSGSVAQGQLLSGEVL